MEVHIDLEELNRNTKDNDEDPEKNPVFKISSIIIALSEFKKYLSLKG